MSKKVLTCIIIAVVIIALLIAMLIYYSIPFVELNSAVVYANRNDIVLSETEDDVWIMSADLQKLDVIDKSISKNDVFVDIDTKLKIQSISYNNVVIEYDITAVVKDLESFETINEFSQTRTVSCSFNHFKWKVDYVE